MAVASGMGSGIIITIMSPPLAAFTVMLGILNILANTYFVKPVKKVSTKAQESLSSITQRLSDILAGSQVIKIFGIKKPILDKYSAANDDIRKWSMKRVVLNSYLGGVNTFLGFFNFVGISVVGGIMVINGRMSFGTLVAIDQMAGGISWMFSFIGNYITQLQASLAGADRIFQVLDKPVENSRACEPDKAVNVRVLKKPAGPTPVVEFRDIEFAYDEDKKVLDGLNLKINRDEVIAVVGSSGSGKSTIYKLLLGFYKPGSGNINIQGRPISNYSLDELRGMFAYVPQDNYLYSGTIAENIGYGKTGSSMEQIMECAKAANAHDFIMEFPDGYDTEVGERGARLSGGQRQRIAIARALLKDAPVLLLDEATSALDSESEEQVQKALEALMKGRTTIVVAHRLSTIQNADRILVLEGGKICEEGNHETLMSRGSSYARLYNLQFKNAGIEPA
jgi:ATP-binding cassette subfamily B protein